GLVLMVRVGEGDSSAPMTRQSGPIPLSSGVGGGTSEWWWPVALTGTYVNLSRTQLGPEPDRMPIHGTRYVEREKGGFRAVCRCGWSKRRRSAFVARQALDGHIADANKSAE